MTEPTRKRWRLTRDAAICTFAITMGVFEITLGGARLQVLTFLGGLLVAPAAIRLDEARRNQQ